MNWRKWLFRIVVLPIAHLPVGFRYALSDVLAFVLRRMIKYRRKVIDDNLLIAFPEKTAEERKLIRDGFYAHFTDVILEQTWLFAATAKELSLVCTPTNPEVLETFKDQGGLVCLCAGHFANYEMAVAAVGMTSSYPLFAIYTPLANPYFDGRVKETRGKFGLKLWSKYEAKKSMLDLENETKTYSVGFATDQSPHANATKYWFPFFGRMTAHARGLDVFARKYKSPVIYAWTERVGRGKYTYSYEVICDDASQLMPGEVLQKQAKLLERTIRKDPRSWLWSHRRWKLELHRHFTTRDQLVP